jgi:hypothetical protein
MERTEINGATRSVVTAQSVDSAQTDGAQRRPMTHSTER